MLYDKKSHDHSRVSVAKRSPATGNAALLVSAKTMQQRGVFSFMKLVGSGLSWDRRESLTFLHLLAT